MGVTIDSIQIEIESSSTNAAKGIDALAKSLEGLKKNGSFKAVSNNLNNLSTALNNLPNVHQASNSLRTLANSIERLKGVGSISGISNSLKKLPEALRSVGKIDLESTKTQLEGVANAVSPLSAIKAGGLNTMVNSMKKLGEVTKSLDEKTIGEFAEKVELLNKKLGPLSEKMTSIKAGFSAINSNARSAASGVKKFSEDIDTSTLNMSNFIDVASTIIDSFQLIKEKLAGVISEAIEWDGIAARLGRGFAGEASNTYAWIQRLNEEMGINIQEFMKYSSVYSTMLTGFGVATADAGKMALGYMELTYDIWAGYNDVYGSLEETAEAVKSAIAGEVEPIRRAGFTIVEATLEQTAANHGLEISLANATEAQKSYLRYLTLIDQAHAQSLVGTYAKELNTAEGLMRTFAQQLKSLTQAFGSLFLPILVRVMPYLQAFVELLTEGVYWLANLFGIDIQPVDFSGYESGAGAIEDVANSAGNATGALNDATKAAKELKNATLGIDELNVISPSSATSGSGGSSGGSGSDGFAGLDVDSLWDESIFDSIQSNVDEIKKKLKDWLPVIGGIATALAGLKLTNLLDDIDLADTKLKNLNTVLPAIGKTVSVVGITIAVGKLVWDFTGAYLEGGDESDLLKALGTTTLGTALAYWLAKKPGAAFVLAASGVVTLTKLVIEIGDGTVEWNDTETIITAIVGGLEAAIGGVLTWKTLGPIVKNAWPKIAQTATSVLSKAGPYGWIVAAVVAGITLAFVDYDFSEIGHTLGEKIGGALRTAVGAIWEGLKKAWKWAVDALEIDDLWDVLAILFVPGEWVRRITPEIGNIFSKIVEFIKEKIANLKGNINEFFGGFFDGLLEGLGFKADWIDKFSEMFDIEYLDIVEMVMNPTAIGKHIAKGIWNAMDNNTKTSAIKDKLTSMWNEAKTWWDKTKGSLKEYTPSIGNIASKLSSAWESAKTWWNDKKSALKSYTPSIGSIYEKLKERWDNARTWWNDKKTKAKEYTPSIGSIYEKLSDRWKNAREWWNNKKGSMSYTPSIGSITDKLKSAWNSAKTWWKNNVKLSIPSLSFKVTYSNSGLSVAQKAIVKALDLSGWPKLSFAANGGIFDQGSLIWAGERGPEVMATAAGGKTGVMNVQQMQEAVYEGVYAAMSAAVRGMNGGGSQEVRVYLDGKEITASVKKHQHESGASIMGNEVYSY